MDSRWDSILSGSLTLSFVCEHRSVAYCLICCGYNLGLEIAMVTLLCLLLSATKALFLNMKYYLLHAFGPIPFVASMALSTNSLRALLFEDLELARQKGRYGANRLHA